MESEESNLRMSAFLIDCDWELHLSSDSSIAPSLCKIKDGVFETVRVSHDIVLDLKLMGIIEYRSTFFSGYYSTSVFRKVDMSVQEFASALNYVGSSERSNETI